MGSGEVKARDLMEIYESLMPERSIRVETPPGTGRWPFKTAFAA